MIDRSYVVLRVGGRNLARPPTVKARRARRVLAAMVAMTMVMSVATTVVATPGVVLAQSCAVPADLETATGARERIAATGHLVWPGWNEPPPVLIRSGSGECLIGHPDPPADFVPAGSGAHRREGYLLPMPVATAWPVNDCWSVAIPARNELQAFLDEHLGAGTIDLDPGLYTRAIVHEAFHAFQMTTLGGPDAIPTMGADRPGETLAALRGDAAADGAHDAMGAALTAALDARSAAETLDALTNFLERRDAWWSEAPSGVPGMERHLEWLEGTAHYADVLIGVGAGGGDVSARALHELRDQVAQPTGIGSGLRDRYAGFGAAQAFVLDRWRPGWKERALPGGASLDDLIRSLATDLARVQPSSDATP